MVGQLPGPRLQFCRVKGLDGRPRLGVQTQAMGTRQGLVNDLLDLVMGEGEIAVAGCGPLLDQPPAQQAIQCLEGRLFAPTPGRVEQIKVKLSAEYGRQAQRFLRLFLQTPSPCLDHLAHAGRQRQCAGADPGKVALPGAFLQTDHVRFKERLDDFYQEEGVAFRLAIQPPRQRQHRFTGPGHFHDHRLHGLWREARQAERPGQPFAGQSPAQSPQWMPGADGFGPEGTNDQNSVACQVAGQVVHQPQRGLASPMKVF